MKMKTLQLFLPEVLKTVELETATTEERLPFLLITASTGNHRDQRSPLHSLLTPAQKHTHTQSLRFLSQKAPAVNVLIKQHLNIFQMSDMQRDKASLVFQAGQKWEVHY